MPSARSRLPREQPCSSRQGPKVRGKFWARGHTPHVVAEVSKVIGPQLRSPLVVVAKSLPGRTAEPPLDILPIFVWTPSEQSAQLPLGGLRARGGSISDMRGMRTRCLQMQSWLLGPCRPSYGILTLRRRILCPLGRLWPRRFKEELWFVQTPLLV